MKHDYSLAHLTALSLTPPQLVDVAARTGYRYVGTAHDARHARRGALRPRARQGADEGDQGAARRHRHRRATTSNCSGWIQRSSPRISLRSSMPPPSWERSTSSPSLPDPDRERKTARFARLCDLAKPRGIFVSLEFPHWTETGKSRRGRPRRARRQPDATPASWSTCCTSGDPTRASTSSPHCRASGSVSLTSATRRRRCRRRWRASSARRATSGSFPAKAGSTSRNPGANAAEDSLCAGDSPRRADQGRGTGGGRTPRSPRGEEPARRHVRRPPRRRARAHDRPCGRRRPLIERSSERRNSRHDPRHRPVLPRVARVHRLLSRRDGGAGVRQRFSALCVQLRDHDLRGAFALAIRVADVRRRGRCAARPRAPRHGLGRVALARMGQEGVLPALQRADAVLRLPVLRRQLAADDHQPRQHGAGHRTVVRVVLLQRRHLLLRRRRRSPSAKPLAGGDRTGDANRT